jgi:Zn finger protein HypA/HybF involved in hydrogenase expression
MMVKTSSLTCKRCDHAWTARVNDVRQCPKCKSAKWDVPKPGKDKKCLKTL